MTAPMQCGPDAPVRLAVTGDANRPGKHDYTGAFHPEARRYAGDRVRAVSLTAPKREQRAEIERAIAEARPDELAFFCHGYSLRIELGYDVGNVDDLAAALAAVGCSRVALYACSTGGHRTRGFAARLRDAMCAAGLDARVVASVTAGHASQNPRKRRFDAPAGSPGVDIVERRSPLWRTWCRRLRDGDDPLRWTLLTHDPDAIRRGLSA